MSDSSLGVRDKRAQRSPGTYGQAGTSEMFRLSSKDPKSDYGDSLISHGGNGKQSRKRAREKEERQRDITIE